jgi:hypothetical protein
MSILYKPRWEARDATGNAYSGAKLYVYEAGGLVPASVFADAALSTPLTNPVIADANGRFAQIFVAADTFDVVCKTSADVTLWSDEDVDGLGDSSGTFERDFTNSRLEISGSGGVVSIEAKPPTGDDVGGDGRLGGAEGTQAETWEIDAAAATVTGDLEVNGAITKGGKKIPGVVYTEGSASAQASVDIALPNSPTGVRGWRIEIIGLVLSATTGLRARLAYDATPTFKTGASDYSYGYVTSAGGGVTDLADAANDYIAIGPNQEPTATLLGAGFIDIATPNSGNGATVVSGTFHSVSGGFPLTILFSAQGLGNYGRATYLRLYPGSGTETFTYRVLTRQGFGE